MNDIPPSGASRREITRLISGSAFVFSYRLFGAAATFLTQVLLARWMGAAELGVYVLAFSWCILLATLSTGGFRVASMRFIGEGLAKEKPGYISGYVRRSLQIVIVLSLAVAILGSLGLLVFDAVFDFESSTTLIIALLAVPFFALLNVYAGFANALSRFSLSFMPINVFRPALFLAAICAVWVAGKSLDANVAMLLNCLALGLVAVVTVILGKRALHPHINGSKPQYATRLWIRTALPLLFVALFTGYFPELMVILAGSYLPSEDLAVFHVCFRVAMLISFGLYAIDAFTGPEITQLLTNGDRKKLQQIVNRITRLKFWSALAALVVLGLAGSKILGLFGEEFTPGYSVLMILASAQLVQAAAGPVTRLGSLSGHQNRTVMVFIVAIIVALVLVTILVPLFGAHGAALAALLDTIL